LSSSWWCGCWLRIVLQQPTNCCCCQPGKGALLQCRRCSVGVLLQQQQRVVPVLPLLLPKLLLPSTWLLWLCCSLASGCCRPMAR
jgi:hypothetical protein